jgi:hypothetical protein
MILKKYKGFPNHHEYLRDTLGSKSAECCVVRRAIYLYVQDADNAGAVTGKKKMKKRDESAIHAYSTVMWKISALYSSI